MWNGFAKLRGAWTQGAKDSFYGGLLAALVSAIVIAIAGGLWLWSKSGFSNSAPIAWAAATGAMRVAWAWAKGPVGVPRGLVWLVSTVVAVLFLTKAMPQLIRWLGGINTKLLQVNQKLIASVDLLSPDGAQLKAQKEEPTLSQSAENVIASLASVYPATVALGAFCEIHDLKFAAVEQLFEELERDGYVTIIEANAVTRSAKSVRLTKTGRDYSA